MRTATLFLAASLAATTAPPTAEAQRADRRRSSQSRQAFDAGKKAYNLGDFDRAIELWKEGYEVKDDPIFLYNIAQAYRQMGDYQKAIFFYRAYTREEPRAKNRADVEARIAELGKLLEDQAPEEPPKPVVPPEPPKPEPAPAPEPPPVAPVADARDEAPAHPGRPLKIGGAVAGGLGLVAAGVGVVFLLRSASIEGELEDAARSGEPWSQELVDKESEGETAQTVGWIGVGLGAAGLIAGVTLYLMGAQQDAAARREAQAWQITPLVGETRGVAVMLSF